MHKLEDVACQRNLIVVVTLRSVSDTFYPKN